ncbi:MAG: hypothetical protein JXJ30_07035 [Halothiobacillaceae bacterium]|nr:hypothetical protein [Halothiobacillaceae bacterium]
MAVEKRNPSGSQSIVDQDAAITAYLEGLLRDPEQEEPPPLTRARKAPGLTVIAPESGEVAGITARADNASIDGTTRAATPRDAKANSPGDEGDHTPVDDIAADDIAADDVMPTGDESSAVTQGRQAVRVETVDDIPEEPAEPSASQEAESPVGAAAMAPLESSERPTDAAVPGALAVAARHAPDEKVGENVGEKVGEKVGASTETPAEQPDPSPWAWLRVGDLTLAIPTKAVVSRHTEVVLDPVPGAPAQIAGAMTVDGRPRLILSLASVTGARPRHEATEVLLLGTGGLWGVVGEPAEPPAAFDAGAVQWRDESQKVERRGWLAGTYPAAGVAVLEVAGLRAALSGS